MNSHHSSILALALFSFWFPSALPGTQSAFADPATASVAPRGGDEVIPLIVMDNVGLLDAIKNLARQARLNYIIDPKVPYGSTRADGSTVPVPMVTLRWEKVTARQALIALLHNYDLELVEEPLTSSIRVASPSPAGAETGFKFDFGSGALAPGYARVTPDDSYTKERGFGFEPGSALRAENHGSDPVLGDFITSDKPFYFSVAVPEGNYRVTVTLGDAAGESSTTVKAELRRLMLERVPTANGQAVTRTFVVNVRRPQISSGGQVRLKAPRETGDEAWAWDEKLTLEFNDQRPCVCAVEIARAEDIPTVFLLGDSTVCDQAKEPWNSWGQTLPRFFKPTVAVANHAESGETIASSLGARRFDKVFSLMKPGDYLFVQFGHNDMKDRATNALATYKANLKRIVARTREKGGTPVLITSMERKNGIEQDTLGDYPETVRQVAREDGVPLIDLHQMSKKLYRALGANLDQAFVDGTHHNNFGSYEIAKCVVEGIRQSKLKLAADIVEDFDGFDPTHPDAVESFRLPASPGPTGVRPLGD